MTSFMDFLEPIDEQTESLIPEASKVDTPKAGFEQFLEPVIEDQEEITSNQMQAVATNASRTASRVGEAILGFSGDLASAYSTIITEGTDALAGKFFGKDIVQAKRDQLAQIEQQMAEQGIKKPTGLPTSQQLKETSIELFGEKMKPQTALQEFSDEFFSDAATLAIPIGGSFKIVRPFFTALGSNIAKQFAKSADLSPSVQEATKIGTMLFSGLLGRGAIDKIPQALYKDAAALRPSEANVASGNLLKSIEPIEKGLLAGAKDVPSKKPVLSIISDIKNKASSGKITLEDLETFNKDLNEISSGLYKESKMTAKRTSIPLDQVKKSITSTIEEYGLENPQYYDSWKKANETYGAIAQSRKAREFIGNVYKNYKTAGGAALGVTLGLFGLSPVALPGAIAIAGGAGIGAASEVAVRAFKSPTIRKHYLDVVNSALRENAAQTAKSLSKLSNEIEKQQSNQEQVNDALKSLGH